MRLYQNRLTIALIVLVVVGAIQYIYSASLTLGSSGTIYFLIDDATAEQAGPLRYLKDIVLVLFGLIWPFLIWKKSSGALQLYAVWMLSVLLIGSFPIITGHSFFFLYIAGIRWMILLHACVGIYMLMVQYGIDRRGESLLLKVAIFILAVNAFFTLKQSPDTLAIFWAGLRLTGTFSNAGTLGFFALSMSLLSYAFYRSPSSLVIWLNILAFFVAASSGTRYAIIGVLLITGILIAERFTYRATAKVRGIVVMVVALLAIPSAVGALVAANTIASRGDVFVDQLSEGGRLYNLGQSLDLALQSGAGEILFGEGLGVGTNLALGESQSASYGDEASYGMDMPWNLMIDNSFATTFIQIGLVGSIVFWGPVALFLKNHISRRMLIVFILFVVGLFEQNMAEQYYLMVAFSIVYASERLRRTSINKTEGERA